MQDTTKEEPGTAITLYLNEDSYEFANEYKAREVIEKYCSFMPIPIFLENEDAGEQTEEIPEEEVTEKDKVLDTFIKDAVTEEVEKEDGTKETVEKVPAMLSPPLHPRTSTEKAEMPAESPQTTPPEGRKPPILLKLPDSPPETGWIPQFPQPDTWQPSKIPCGHATKIVLPCPAFRFCSPDSSHRYKMKCFQLLLSNNPSVSG